jgi:hypothetical protein
MRAIPCMLAVTGFLYSDWSLVKFIYKTFGVGHSLKDRCICQWRGDEADFVLDVFFEAFTLYYLYALIV